MERPCRHSMTMPVMMDHTCQSGNKKSRMIVVGNAFMAHSQVVSVPGEQAVLLPKEQHD